MSLAHVHLLINHFPTIGMLIGLGLFVIGLIGKSDDLKRASLVVFLGIGLVAIPTYMSGNAAQLAIAKSPGVSKTLIQTHEGAALLGLAVMELTAAFAWLGLWQFRRTSRVPRWNLSVILLLSVATFGLMARAANIGGEIRHPEIVSGQETTTVEGPLGRQVGGFVTSVKWMWPTCETLHFVGLSLLFGVASLVDLRILGMMKNLPFAALHRLLPWGILGFGINTVTGMLFFVATPEQYTNNVAFQWKVVLMLLAGINVLYFTAFDETWVLKAGDDAPLTAKFVAATAMILVIGVMYCGRMLPFIGNAF